jgi:AbrB family looped-hinge helix DNA binding protein
MIADCPVTLGDRGRLVLPAAIREQLQLHCGERFLARVEEDGSIRLVSFASVAQRNRGLFAEVAAGRSLVDELIAERRAAASLEPGA